MRWLTEPFTADFMSRALLGGVLVATVCAIVGTWVVVRGMAFLGEAMAHGMLPGVAAATLLGVPVLLGAAVSAVVMSLGVGLAARGGRLSQDTSIGLLFVWMLGLGVILISHSSSFATDATAILFGDILAVNGAELNTLVIALAATLAIAIAFHRHFVALSFDPRVASTLGLRPRLAHVLLVGLVTLAVVASYRAVGSLLVVGLLLGPAVAARPWTRRLPSGMALAVMFGAAAVPLGLLASWHGGTAAGASIAVAAIGLAVVSGAVRRLAGVLRRRRPGVAVAALISALISALSLSACTAGDTDPARDVATSPTGHGYVEGAREMAEPQLHLATVAPSGDLDLLDLLDGRTRTLGSVEAVSDLDTDGRFLFVGSASSGTVGIYDSGVWTWDHEDHFHYYRAEPREIGTVTGTGAAAVVSGTTHTAVFFPATGRGHLLDHDALADGELGKTDLDAVPPHEGLVVPLGDQILRTLPGAHGSPDRVRLVGAEGGRGKEYPCPRAEGSILSPAGAVIGCADGALLASRDGAQVTVEHIPYPRRLLREQAPARSFHAREGRPTVAAPAGPRGIWLLDTRTRQWSLLRTPTRVVRATAVDDAEGHVLALAADGRVLVLAGDTGRLLATSRRLVLDPEAHAGVELVADQQRAYLNDPTGRRVHEIDFADGARVARTFDTTGAPSFLARTGR